MSRRESVNTFTDGLVKDLNPINTPNSVLTDCLNGTLITYNGNEYSLQNDRGNYLLKDCELDENYIPVGTAEHGGILYIVSYNPIDDKVQIGSYPSPQISNEFNSEDTSITNFNNIISGLSLVELNYSTLYKKAKLYYLMGDTPEDYKLYPGDKYKLEHNPPQLGCIKWDYFIIDENQNQIPVKLNLDNKEHYVDWETPGWLAVKPTIATIDDFSVNTTLTTKPHNDNIEQINVSVKVYVSDESLYGKLYFYPKLIIDGNPDNRYSTNHQLTDYVDLGNGTRVYYKTVLWEDINLSKNHEFEIEVIPKYKYVENAANYLVYDNYTKTQTIESPQQINTNDIKIGENLWQYFTGDDKLTIHFDTTGAGSAADVVLLSDELSLYYTIQYPYLQSNSVAWDDAKDIDGNSYQDIKVPEWYLAGRSLLEIPLVSYASNDYTSGKLCAENIYSIQFKIKDSNGNVVKSFDDYKIVIASKVMNDFKDERFDLIYFDSWYNKYYDFIEKPSSTVSVPYDVVVDPNPNYDIWDPYQTVEPNENDIVVRDTNGNYGKWSSRGLLVKYPRLMDATNDWSKGVHLLLQKPSNISINIKPNFKFLVGPLWEQLINNAELKYTIKDLGNSGLEQNFTDSSRFNSQTGIYNSSNIVCAAQIKSKLKFDYKFVRVGEPTTAWNYELNDIKMRGGVLRAKMYGVKNDDGRGTKVYCNISYGGCKTNDSHIFYEKQKALEGDWGNIEYNDALVIDEAAKLYVDQHDSLKYDVLLIQVVPDIDSDPSLQEISQWGGVAIYPETIDSEIHTNVNNVGNNNKVWSRVGYFNTHAVDKNPSYLLAFGRTEPVLLRIYDRQEGGDIFNNIKHLVCHDETSFVGCYYQLICPENQSMDLSVNLEIYGSISTKWTFLYKDMGTTERSVFARGYGNNFSLSGSNTVIETEHIIEESPININKTVEDSTFTSKVDTFLNGPGGLNESINSQNADITSEYNLFKKDKIYNSHEFTSDSNKYIFVPTNDVPSNNHTKILALLNDKTYNGIETDKLMSLHRITSYGYPFDYCYYLGNVIKFGSDTDYYYQDDQESQSSS